MLGSSSQPDPHAMSAGEKHIAVMQYLDEIKRYVAGIFSKVDTEVEELSRIVDRLENTVRNYDQQINRIDQIERSVRNIENTVKEIERKVR